MRDGQWSAAIERSYNIRDLSTLQNTWVAWVSQGFPVPPAESNVMTAAAQAPAPAPPAAMTAVASLSDARRARPEPNLVYRTYDKGAAQPAAAGGTQILARPNGAPLPPPGQDTAQNAPLASLPQMLPAQGWRTAAGTAAESTADQPSAATTSHVARPPTMEPSGPVILEWQQR
jgi:hypothetical protein